VQGYFSMKLRSTKLRSTVIVMALAAQHVLLAGCSSSSPQGPGSGGNSSSGGSKGSGGSNGSGGTSSGGSNGSGSGGSGTSSGGSNGSGSGGDSGQTCTNVNACGGAVPGTWTVMSSCLNVSGDLDLRGTFGFTCPAGKVTGSLHVTGTWTVNADGTIVDNTMTTGTEHVTMGSECKVLSMAPISCETIGQHMGGGYYDTADCKDDAATGGCDCTATVKQMGSMGLTTSNPNTTDINYTTADNTITITQDKTKYQYCVDGNKLTVTPQGGPAATGTIVLMGSGTSTGSGGAAGGKGSGGSNGSGGAGGRAAGGASGGGGRGAGGGSTGSGGAGTGTRTDGPCDIYAAANVPCGGAYSMVRALSKGYTGPLYQVRIGSNSMNTGSGGTLKDIGMLADGYADTAAVDAACMGTVCTVATLYDQSGNKNDLIRGSKGPAGNGDRSGADDYESTVKEQVTAGGHKVYVLYMVKFEGYRTPLNVTGKGLPTGNKAQGIYELVDGVRALTDNGPCCWDFGSVSPDPSRYVTMNTLFFGKGFWGTGAGSAPWFMGDFEGGVWAGGSGGSNTNNPMNPSMKGVQFALGILHTPVGKYALRMADTSKATDLTTAYDGNIPSGKTWGNAGGITLGVGGDNSNNASGTFYEGALTNGSPTNDTDLLIMKNIQAVGYTK